MARTNNLTNFLTDVASAIKEKKGSQTNIPASNFDTEILALPSQGTYQEKTVTITQNGQTALTPDSGYDAMERVEITVNVPLKQLQSKTVSVTSNGNVSLLPDSGYDGFNEVNLQVNVPTGTSNENDVIFYDYDGTVVASYSANDFANLTALPSNPSHTGLIAQGWNWSLSDAKTYVTTYGRLNIGQMYITDDGKTRLYIHLDDGRLKPYLAFAVNGSVTVDWGDGNTQTVTGNSISTTIYTQHIYFSAGNYIITLNSTSTIYLLGNSIKGGIITKNSSILSENIVYQNSLNKVELGSNVIINNYAFNNCYSLQSITIPNSITNIGDRAFNGCYSLQSITIPSGVTSIGTYAFNNCYSLQSITIPSGVTSIEGSTFRSCYSLQSITIPSGVTSIGTYAFAVCYSLQSITIPSGVTSIEGNTFRTCASLQSITIPSGVTSIEGNTFNGCYSLQSITIPSGVTSIEDNAFNNCASLQSITIPSGVTSIEDSTFFNCSGIGYYDFTSHSAIPTLSNRNAFNNISSDCKIVVPDNLYNDWIAVTNWSTYASYIIKESDWT